MIKLFHHRRGRGRKFHIKLVERDGLDSYDTESEGQIVSIPGGRGLAMLMEGPTVYFDIKEFAYHYKCKHCGHEWTENREIDKPVEVDMDPIND